jgi:hypothetical protein
VAVSAPAQSFADEVAASLPPRIRLPDELRQALIWMENEGFIRTYRDGTRRYAALYPVRISNGTSIVSIEICDSGHVLAWTRGNTAAAERLAPIIRTGGDGSYAALWLDESGRQRFVHLGSGSGSTMLGVLCDSAIDMLRLMAIGYEELCWQNDYSSTPQEVLDERGPSCGCEDDAEDVEAEVVPPVELAGWVETTFAAKVPEHASEIVRGRVADMMDDDSDDPFWRWIRAFDR